MGITTSLTQFTRLTSLSSLLSHIPLLYGSAAATVAPPYQQPAATNWLHSPPHSSSSGCVLPPLTATELHLKQPPAAAVTANCAASTITHTHHHTNYLPLHIFLFLIKIYQDYEMCVDCISIFI